MEAQFPIEMDQGPVSPSKFPIMNGPETPFLKVPLTFRARIGVLSLPYICIQLQSFVNFENDTIGLSVKEAKLTGL